MAQLREGRYHQRATSSLGVLNLKPIIGGMVRESLEDLQAALEDRYHIERPLGKGGMATVYLAEDKKYERKVALKVLHPELSATLGADRFHREIKFAAQLSHPHILPLYESGAAEHFLFYVMPYVEGESLRVRMDREKQLPLEDALRITSEMGEALAHSHQLGIVHRDIKPENILLSQGHAMLLDFGIARAVSVAGGERLTATGLAVGTPWYMSPEQAMGNPDVDDRTDLYSLALVLFEMLMGGPAHSGPTPQAIIARRLKEDTVPTLRTVLKDVPEHVDLAVQKALARKPEDRFGNVAAFIEALTNPDAGTPRRKRFSFWR